MLSLIIIHELWERYIQTMSENFIIQDLDDTDLNHLTH